LLLHDGNDNDTVSTGKGKVIMSDIVTPTMTGTNTSQTVISKWDLDGSVGFNEYGSSGQMEMALYYDEDWNGLGDCRIVWSYYKDYGNSPLNDEKVWGYSDCNATTPNPQGLYDQTIQAEAGIGSWDDPFRATKYVYNITKIPSGVATAYFDGDQMLLGPGKSSGSRGSSAGPSVVIRPWTFPTDSDGWDEAVSVLYYNSSSGYTRWYQDTAFRGTDDTNWWVDDWVVGQEMIRVSYLGDNYEALVVLGRKSAVDTSTYPYNDANAKPTVGSYTTETYWNQCANGHENCGGTVTGTNSWPNPTYVPRQWYGTEDYDAGQATVQNPSFTDHEGDGSDMPGDTNLVSVCSHGTGPTSDYRNMHWWFYDLAEIGAMYQGTSSYGPGELQPYDQKVWFFDPENNGRDNYDNCIQPQRQYGIAYDHTNQLMYLSVPTDPGTSGTYYDTGVRRGIVVFSVDVTGSSAPSSATDTLVGASVAGGAVE
jgi:hypothetical protein